MLPSNFLPDHTCNRLLKLLDAAAAGFGVATPCPIITAQTNHAE